MKEEQESLHTLASQAGALNKTGMKLWTSKSKQPITDKKQAVNCWREAVKIFSNYSNARINLAFAYLQEGEDIPWAIYCFVKACVIGNNTDRKGNFQKLCLIKGGIDANKEKVAEFIGQCIDGTTDFYKNIIACQKELKDSDNDDRPEYKALLLKVYDELCKKWLAQIDAQQNIKNPDEVIGQLENIVKDYPAARELQLKLSGEFLDMIQAALGNDDIFFPLPTRLEKFYLLLATYLSQDQGQLAKEDMEKNDRGVM